MRRVTIRTLTPGPAVVEAAVSSRDLPLRCSPHKSAAVMGLHARQEIVSASNHYSITQSYAHAVVIGLHKQTDRYHNNTGTVMVRMYPSSSFFGLRFALTVIHEAEEW